MEQTECLFASFTKNLPRLAIAKQLLEEKCINQIWIFLQGIGPLIYRAMRPSKIAKTNVYVAKQ